MSFRENLLKKIEIGELSERVARSLGTLGSGKKIDRKAMQRLLELAGWRYRRERDLDLYLPTNPENRTNCEGLEVGTELAAGGIVLKLAHGSGERQ